MWLNIYYYYYLLSIVWIKIDISLSVGEISKTKCEEYSRAVYFVEDSPVLLANPGNTLVSACGIVEVPLIVGGIDTENKEFPHTAVVGHGLLPNGDLSWQCGGALISDIFVLTAAHCLNSRESGPAQRVMFGINDLKSRNGLQEVMISARIPHPDYKPPIKYNDIALLKLIESVVFTPFVRPACLNAEPNVRNTRAIATGFGKLSFESTVGSNYLMKVQLSIIPNGKCSQSFASAADARSMPAGVINSLLCAGELSGGKDTCQGDSGGPLQVVVAEPYCMYSLIGITSFGKFCGFANSPAVYTRVSYFVGWIESIPGTISGGPLLDYNDDVYCTYSIIGVASFGKSCGTPNTPDVYTNVSAFVEWIESTVWP